MTKQFNFPNPIMPGQLWGKDAKYHVPIVSSVGNGPKGEKGESFTYDELTEEQKTDLVQTAMANGIVKGDKGDKGDTGDQGPIGETFTFDDLTEQQLETLRQDISTVYYVREDEIVYTEGTNTTTIEIPFEEWSEHDIILLDVEGLALACDIDWDIYNGAVRLAEPITHDHTAVHFTRICAYGIDNEAETALVQEVAGRVSEHIVLDTDIEDVVRDEDIEQVVNEFNILNNNGNTIEQNMYVIQSPNVLEFILRITLSSQISANTSTDIVKISLDQIMPTLLSLHPDGYPNLPGGLCYSESLNDLFLGRWRLTSSGWIWIKSPDTIPANTEIDIHGMWVIQPLH